MTHADKSMHRRKAWKYATFALRCTNERKAYIHAKLAAEHAYRAHPELR